MYVITFVYPRNMTMDISNSIHDSYEDTSRELERLCYSMVEIDTILTGDTYEDDESWVKVTKVDV